MSEATADLRVYAPSELGIDGYPISWKEINVLVVEEAGSRCVRCGHPYRKGQHGNGEWSRCDEQCTHSGPLRSISGGVIKTVHSPSERPNAVIEAQWRILTVHHLNGDKADCRWWNLCALCQRCHLTIQGRVKMNQLYPYEHSTWFKPYAAGYYAWVYAGLALSREETMERLDELLALERVI